MEKKSEREIKELIKKYEHRKVKTGMDKKLYEQYLKQTDRNYKDGDRN